MEWIKFNCSERRRLGSLGSFCEFFSGDGYAGVSFHDFASGLLGSFSVRLGPMDVPRHEVIGDASALAQGSAGGAREDR